MKRCKICGAYLDPDEWCECEVETVDMIRRPAAKRKTTYPREWVPESYTRPSFKTATSDKEENMSIFESLNRINVGDHTEKKNGLTYLSWAWAWAEVKKLYPEARYTIYERETEFGPVNYFTDGRTCWVKTGVTIEGLEHIEELPVMDFKNRSIAYDAVTSMDTNKAIQRSLTKACARHGLGLYIYAGEDLPEEEAAAEAEKKAAEQEAKQAEREARQAEANARNAARNAGASAAKMTTSARIGIDRKALLNATMEKLGCNVEQFGMMRQTLIDGGAVVNKPTKELTDDEYKQLLDAVIANFAA